jgi:hypothetical protein
MLTVNKPLRLHILKLRENILNVKEKYERKKPPPVINDWWGFFNVR